MSVTATPVFPQAPTCWGAIVQNSTGAWTVSITVGTNLVSLVAGGTNGTKVEAINVTTTDTSADSLYLVLYNGTNYFILGYFNIPAGAGSTSTSTPSVGLLNNSQLAGLSFDSAGNKYLYIPNGSTLYVGVSTAVTSAKYLAAVAVGANF